MLGGMLGEWGTVTAIGVRVGMNDGGVRVAGACLMKTRACLVAYQYLRTNQQGLRRRSVLQSPECGQM